MKSASRWTAVGGAVTGLLLLGALSLTAQEPEGKGGKASAKRNYDPARRVPNHFGQLGLTSEQKESIYKIRGNHYREIDALQKQIADLQAKMLTECESVLNETQKALLASRRKASAQGKKGGDPTPTPKDQAKPAN